MDLNLLTAISLLQFPKIDDVKAFAFNSKIYIL